MIRVAGGRTALSTALAGLCLLLAGTTCDNSRPGPDIEVKRSALAGDPIESVQQVEGVAPTTINNVLSPPDDGAIDSTSFTIGLFDEDVATKCARRHCAVCLLTANTAVTCGCDICTISADLNPAHPTISPFPAFDDVSTVEVTINVGDAQAMHWDWDYNAYYEAPFGEFSAEVVDQNGQTTTVIDKASAPAGHGYRPDGPGPFQFVKFPFRLSNQHVDLDLTPWADQKIRVRFILHSNYDPHWFDIVCHPFICFEGYYDAGASKAYVRNLRVDKCSVTSVEFEEVNSALDPNPSYAGGGKRIFPDRQSPMDATDRSTVNVVVRSQPNCKINLMSFDVDDVSDDPVIDTNGPDPGDNDTINAGADYGAWTVFPGREAEVSIGANGAGRTEFRVSDQPGANFVIVADRDVSKLRTITISGSSIKWSDGKDVLDSARTPMLTVWRRLHIERDAMEPVVENHIAGRILSVTPDRQCKPNSPVGIRVDAVLAPHPNVLDRFQFGRLVAGGRSVLVAESLEHTICVAGTVAGFLDLQGQSFSLYDDDDFNRNDGLVLRGDEGESLRVPSTAMLQDSDVRIDNVLAVAYIRPTYDIGGGTAPFLLNVPNYNNLAAHFFFNNEANNDSDFWAVYLLGAYQGKEDHCHDPNGPSVLRGLSNKDGSMIFLESIADLGALVPGDESDVVAHEIGHLLCADHGEKELMGGKEGGIRGHTFSRDSIAVIRKALKWKTDSGCP